MCAQAVAGVGGSATKRTTVSPLDGDYSDKLEFIRAWLTLSPWRESTAKAAGRRLRLAAGARRLTYPHIGEAFDDTIPVLESVADRLDAETRRLSNWNVEAAGRNEIILADVKRNWLEIERLASLAVDE